MKKNHNFLIKKHQLFQCTAHWEKKEQKKHHMLKRGGAPNVERHMVDQVFQNELRDLKDKCCVYMTFYCFID